MILNNLIGFLTWTRIKTFLILAAAILVIWFYKDYSYQVSENKRQTENFRQLQQQDSMRYSQMVLTKKELENYLENNNKELLTFLDQNKIDTKKIERIISQKLNYTDTRTNTVDLQPVLDAIKEQKNARIAVTDSTKCMVIKGFVVFKNDTLKLDITDREFKNSSEVVSYYERRQWKFLGIKTRLFGKKQLTVIIKDDCGRSETVIIDLKKK